MGWWEDYIKSIEDWWKSIREADTFLEKVKLFIVGEGDTWEFIEALLYAAPFGSPVAAGVKVLPKFGTKIAGLVERFVAREGLAVEAQVVKSGAFLLTKNARTAASVISLIAKAGRTVIPYVVADIATEITGKVAFQMAKKAIADLIATVLKPAFTRLISLRVSLLNFIESMEAAFIRLRIWQSGVNKILAELQGLQLSKLAGIIIALQAQIDKYVIQELIKLRADLTALELSCNSKYAALNAKIDTALTQGLAVAQANLIAHIAEFHLFSGWTKGSIARLDGELLIQKAVDSMQSAEISLLKAQVKQLPQTIGMETNFKIMDTWNDRLPEPTEQEINNIADSAAAMLGWLPAEITKVYAPLLPEIIGAIGKEFNVYG